MLYFFFDNYIPEKWWEPTDSVDQGKPLPVSTTYNSGLAQCPLFTYICLQKGGTMPTRETLYTSAEKKKLVHTERFLDVTFLVFTLTIIHDILKIYTQTIETSSWKIVRRLSDKFLRQIIVQTFLCSRPKNYYFWLGFLIDNFYADF